MCIKSGDQRILMMSDRTRVKATKAKTPPFEVHLLLYQKESYINFLYGRWNAYEGRSQIMIRWAGPVLLFLSSIGSQGQTNVSEHSHKYPIQI